MPKPHIPTRDPSLASVWVRVSNTRHSAQALAAILSTHMRLRLIFGLILLSTGVSGQTKKELIGEYKHSIFMYSFMLTLKDSSKYVTVESSDLSYKKTTGTWTIRGQAVRLTPKTLLELDRAAGQKEEEKSNDSGEQVVVIHTMNILYLKRETDDLKLERIK